MSNNKDQSSRKKEVVLGMSLSCTSEGSGLESKSKHLLLGKSMLIAITTEPLETSKLLPYF